MTRSSFEAPIEGHVRDSVTWHNGDKVSHIIAILTADLKSVFSMPPVLTFVNSSCPEASDTLARKTENPYKRLSYVVNAKTFGGRGRVKRFNFNATVLNGAYTGVHVCCTRTLCVECACKTLQRTCMAYMHARVNTGSEQFLIGRSSKYHYNLNGLDPSWSLSFIKVSLLNRVPMPKSHSHTHAHLHTLTYTNWTKNSSSISGHDVTQLHNDARGGGNFIHSYYRGSRHFQFFQLPSNRTTASFMSDWFIASHNSSPHSM